MPYTGTICERHPLTEGLRYGNGHCVSCAYEYRLRWRAENPKKVLQQQTRSKISRRTRAAKDKRNLQLRLKRALAKKSEAVL